MHAIDGLGVTTETPTTPRECIAGLSYGTMGHQARRGLLYRNSGSIECGSKTKSTKHVREAS